jgi:hypothetical protein
MMAVLEVSSFERQRQVVAATDASDSNQIKRVRMKVGLRMSSAAFALAVGLAVPAHAQDEALDSASPPTIVAPPTAPSSEGAIGPVQLRDFSINGTVTRRAETAETPTPQPRSRGASAAPESSSTQPASEVRRSVAAAAADPQPAAPPARRPAASPALPSAIADNGFNFTPSAAAASQPASFGGAPAAAAAPPIVDTATSEANFFLHWPWLLALLAAIGAGLWYFRRQRPGYAFAGAGADSSALDFSPDQSAPSPRTATVPRPAPHPGPTDIPPPASSPAPQGIVSVRLRPWLEIECVPQAAIIDADKGSIQFEVFLFNSGSAPARDVLVEAALFNAGPDQDQVIGKFFDRPAGPAQEGTTIPPLQRMNFRSIVSLPRDQLQIFEVEGRRLFVPLIGFNARYRWSGGSGQTSASFIVGRSTAGEKMGPFKIEKDAKTYRGLAAREHSLRIRK